MTIEIDTDDVVTEITESYGFTSWIDERIDERVHEYELPDDVTRDRQLDEFVGREDLASSMRSVFESYDADWLSMPSTASVDADQLNEYVIEQLNSMPGTSEGRCRLGRSVERAMLKVLCNVLRGDRLLTADEDGINMDGELAALAQRILPGAITSPPTPVQAEHVFSPLDYVTCDDATDSPHLWVSDCRNPVLAAAPGARVENTLPDTGITPDVVFIRECMVLTMSGQRDGGGAVSVWTSQADEWFQVRKVRYDATTSYEVIANSRSQAEAFTAAFAAAAWGVTVTNNR